MRALLYIVPKVLLTIVMLGSGVYMVLAGLGFSDLPPWMDTHFMLKGGKRGLDK